MPTASEWTAAAIPIVRQKEVELEARITVAKQTADQLRRRERAVLEERESIQIAWKALRKTCPHPDEEDQYVPDPSGNSGSYYECNICGRQT
jgi:hypothetical protein